MGDDPLFNSIYFVSIIHSVWYVVKL
jgi:hypothetical protein